LRSCIGCDGPAVGHPVAWTRAGQSRRIPMSVILTMFRPARPRILYAG
jgi:hypothetical protein